jgi:hypothetical protein
MRVFCLPAVQTREGQGVTPWGVVRIGAASHARKPIRPVDASPFAGYDSSCTTAEDARMHQDQRHRERPTDAETRGNGPRLSRLRCTADTTDGRTGIAYGCAANVSCRQHHHARRVLCSPAAGDRRSGPLPSTRRIRVSGRGYGAYAAGGPFGGMIGGLIGVPSGWRGVRSIAVSRPACRIW